MRLRRVRVSIAMAIAMLALVAWNANGNPASSRPVRQTSTTLGPPIPEARAEVAGALWYGKIAVAGGFPGTDQSNDRFDLFDVSRRRWSPGPTLPHHYDHTSLAQLGSRLYLIGGYTSSFSNPTNEVWSLGRRETIWRREPDLATRRGALGTASVAGKLVAIGGVDESRAVLSSTEIFTPGVGWSAGPELSIPREHLGAAGAGDKVYAVAGRNSGGATPSVESLVIGNRQWRAEPALHDARGGIGAAASASGRVCTGGGEVRRADLDAAGVPGQPNTVPSIECLRRGRWQRVANLRVPRHGLAVVAQGNRVHFVAGSPKAASFDSSNTHEVLAL
jgi:hypothetical protein